MLTITDSTIVARYAHAAGVKRAAVEIHDALLKNVDQFLKAAGIILQENDMTLPDLEARLNECSQFQLKDICTELLSAVGASACFVESTADKGHAAMFSMLDEECDLSDYTYTLSMNFDDNGASLLVRDIVSK